MARKLTQEQNDIINLSKQMKTNESLKIQACAGSGKTSTLVEIAMANPNQNFLYLAFNRSVTEEAKKKFPNNVKVRTTHSLAHDRIIKQSENTITVKHTFDDYEQMLDIDNYGDYYIFNRLLNRFLNSHLKEFDSNMVEELFKIARKNKEKVYRHSTYFQEYQFHEKIKLHKIIKRLFELARNKKMAYTHSMYLKEYQLLNPEDRRLDKYDFILLDEAQDTNAVVLDIFMSNNCKKILVGDTFQNIYGFRDTINALEIMPTTYEKSLTYSFRCKQPILSKACYFLNKYGGAEDVFFHSAYQEKENETKTSAMITRTNVGIIRLIAIEAEKNKATDANDEEVYKYKLLKKPDDVFKASLNLLYLELGQEDKMDREFKWLAKLSKDELEEVAEEDIEIKTALQLIDKYKEDPSYLPYLFDLAKKMYHIKEADIYLTNAHVSKGLEWNIVTLYDDFPSLAGIKKKIENEELKEMRGEKIDKKEIEYLYQKLKEETNLYYVALTRAKDKSIDCSENDYEGWQSMLQQDMPQTEYNQIDSIKEDSDSTGEWWDTP